MKKFDEKRVVKEARRVIDIEIENIMNVRKCLGSEFVKAIRMLACCQGKVIVTGIGKSGIIGRKNFRDAGKHRHTFNIPASW